MYTGLSPLKKQPDRLAYLEPGFGVANNVEPDIPAAVRIFREMMRNINQWQRQTLDCTSLLGISLGWAELPPEKSEYQVKSNGRAVATPSLHCSTE